MGRMRGLLQGPAAVALILCGLASVSAHVAPTFPPARKYDFDFLDTFRTITPSVGLPPSVLATPSPVGNATAKEPTLATSASIRMTVRMTLIVVGSPRESASITEGRLYPRNSVSVAWDSSVKTASASQPSKRNESTPLRNGRRSFSMATTTCLCGGLSGAETHATR